jgi:hypothetical protein
MRSVLVVVVGSVLVAAGAFAAEPDTNVGSNSLAYLQAGYSAGGHGRDGAAIGGQFVQAISPRFALEVAGSHVPGRGMRAGATSATLGVLFHLRAPSAKAVPYLALGGGIHHGPELGQGAMRGPGWESGGYPGGMMGNGPGYGPPGSGNGPRPGMPMYGLGPGSGPYGTRSGAFMGTGSGRGYADETSTDPAFLAGGGIRIDLGSSLFLRPDARATIVVSDDDTRVVATWALSIGYGF